MTGLFRILSVRFVLPHSGQFHRMSSFISFIAREIFSGGTRGIHEGTIIFQQLLYRQICSETLDQKRDLLRRQWPRDLFVYFRLKFHLEIQSFEIMLIIRNSSYFIILQFYTLDEKDPRKLNNCNKIRFSKEHHPPPPFINFLSHH